MKELAIGEEIRIRCVEDKNADGKCTECHLSHKYPCFGNCYPAQRIDGKQVHYELVENPEPITLPTDEEISAYSAMYYTGSAVHFVREGMRIMKKMIEEKLKDKGNESK